MSSESTREIGPDRREAAPVPMPAALLDRISACVTRGADHAEVALLLERLVTESELRSAVQDLGMCIRDKDGLCSRVATLVEGCVDYSVLAVVLFTGPRPYVYIRMKERVGLETMRTLRAALARRSGRLELELVWPETERPRLDLLLAPESAFDPAWPGPPSPPTASLPLVVGPEIHGAVCVIPRGKPALEEREAWCLEVIASALAPVARCLAWHDEAQRLAVTDSLTGVYNCGHFMRILEEHFKVFKRYGNPFTLVMVDVDRFKQVNEEHGRETGDAVLAGVARLLQKSLREVDLVARYGSDEFILLLPQTGLAPAVGVCERIRRSLEKGGFVETPVPVPITASFGVSEAAEECLGSFDLVDATDRALYASKQAGRNCVRSGGPAL